MKDRRNSKNGTARHAPAHAAQRYSASAGRYGSGNTRAAAYRPADALEANARYNAKRAKKRRRRIALGVVCVLVAALAAVVVLNPLHLGSSGSASSSSTDYSFFANLIPSEPTVGLPTPIMAESDGIELHSAVAMQDLTEILIHNASYSYACAITTQLTEATNTDVIKNHGTGRKASTQPTGDNWMTGEFIRCFRAGNGGARMSAIDCGATPGTQVYAPVSGKVVLVKAYKLYDKYDDYQIHIQPEGRSDIDVVMIHLTDVTIQAGDTVEAGVTPIAKIRDVYSYIGEEMQLKEYTAEGDNGNHTHIQVNNAADETYHGLDDLKQ